MAHECLEAMINRRFDRIESILSTIEKKENDIMSTVTVEAAEIEKLRATAHSDTDARNAILGVILGLVTRLQASQTAPDPVVSLQSIIDEVSANASALATAAVAN
ncbi:MAG TPA: hypothetical protein VJW73_10975, partial [Gemmatimonadaceae bacterium]|nr:hypothetical protein [Gemmatimonadaceae bacterium]